MQTPTNKTVIIRITIIIAVAEALIMLILGRVTHDLSSPYEAVLDALLLVALTTPLIHQWVIKPYVVARDEAIKKVTYMAFHDPLTQLANRHLISEYLKKVVARVNRKKNYGAVLLIDLDEFKPINDQHGHDAGDAILIEIAIRLQASVRADDIAGRLGGDEFVVIFSDLDTDKALALQQIQQIAERIQAVIQEPVDWHGTYRLSASIGMRLLGHEKVTLDKIIKDADIAMYQAKQMGRGCSVIFDP